MKNLALALSLALLASTTAANAQGELVVGGTLGTGAIVGGVIAGAILITVIADDSDSSTTTTGDDD